MEGLLSAKVQRFITARVLSLLSEAARLPANRPFTPVIHRSFATQGAYRGVSQLVTGLTAQVRDFQSPFWLTLKQIIEAGGRVVRSEFARYTPMVLWKRVSWRKDGAYHSCLLPARFIKVWNIEQTTLEVPPTPAPVPRASPLKAIRRVIQGLPKQPVILLGEKAMYRPGDDVMFLPDASSFASPEAAAATFLHELCHWSGHPSRLNRRTLRDAHPFGSPTYGEEELTAELAVTWLMAHLGIQPAESRNSAAYLKGWSGILTDDSKAVFRLAGQAQKIVDYLLFRKSSHADLAENDPMVEASASG